MTGTVSSETASRRLRADLEPYTHRHITRATHMARSPASNRIVEATPILNGPYEEPGFHYATTTDGNLDYQDKRSGRRIFAPETPQVPLGP